LSNTDRVREFVVDNFLFGEDGDLREDTSFLEDAVIDSTGILELVTYLEETFGITVEDEEMVPENLDSLRSIGSYLESKLGGKAAEG
jgi:acyl carrier protein